MAPTFGKHYNEIPVVKTVALQNEGVKELFDIIVHQLQKAHISDKRFWLLAERAFQLIQKKRMSDVDKALLKKDIELNYKKGNFNLYKFIAGR